MPGSTSYYSNLTNSQGKRMVYFNCGKHNNNTPSCILKSLAGGSGTDDTDCSYDTSTSTTNSYFISVGSNSITNSVNSSGEITYTLVWNNNITTNTISFNLQPTNTTFYLVGGGGGGGGGAGATTNTYVGGGGGGGGSGDIYEFDDVVVDTNTTYTINLGIGGIVSYTIGY